MNLQNRDLDFILQLLQTHNYNPNDLTKHPLTLENLRLIYNSNRDGMNIDAHDRLVENQCDCVYIVRTQDGHTFGYYIDYPNGTTISSFMFSVDKRQKYDLEEYEFMDQHVAYNHPVDLNLFWNNGQGWYYDEDHYYRKVTCYDSNYIDDDFDYKTVFGNCRPTTEEEIEMSGGYEAYIFDIAEIEVYTIKFNVNSSYTVSWLRGFDDNITNKDNWNVLYQSLNGHQLIGLYQATLGEWSSRKRYYELQRQLRLFGHTINRQRFRVLILVKTTEGKTFGMQFGVDFNMFEIEYTDTGAQLISIDLNEVYNIPTIRIRLSTLDINIEGYDIDLFSNYAVPYECTNKPLTGEVDILHPERKTVLNEIFGIEVGQEKKKLEFIDIEVYALTKNGQIV